VSVVSYGIISRVVEAIHSLPEWSLWVLIGLGLLLLVRAFNFWKLSWSGSGYKGITAMYWASLSLKLMNAALLLGLGVIGLATNG
jgi:hypothetical protein